MTSRDITPIIDSDSIAFGILNDRLLKKDVAGECGLEIEAAMYFFL